MTGSGFSRSRSEECRVSDSECRGTKKAVSSDECQGKRDFPLDTRSLTLVSFRLSSVGFWISAMDSLSPWRNKESDISYKRRAGKRNLRLIGKRAHADHRIVDDTELMFPVRSRFESRDNLVECRVGRRHRNAKQNYTARSLGSFMEHKFSEVLVESDEEPRLG